MLLSSPLCSSGDLDAIRLWMEHDGEWIPARRTYQLQTDRIGGAESTDSISNRS